MNFFLGRLIVSNQTIANISKAHINIPVDNYANFYVKGNVVLNSSFINHEIGVLKIDSQGTNITSQNQGRIINYGYIFSSSETQSNITLATNIVNMGYVDIQSNKWEVSGKNYTQFSGETHFIDISAGSIKHYGGGFHGYHNSQLKTTNGYDYYQGAIFPGGRYFRGIKEVKIL